MERIKALAASVATRLRKEPVIVAYGVALALSLGAYFGLEASLETVALIDMVIGFGAALFARQKVAPVAILKELSTEELVEKIHGSFE